MGVWDGSNTVVFQLLRKNLRKNLRQTVQSRVIGLAADKFSPNNVIKPRIVLSDRLFGGYLTWRVASGTVIAVIETPTRR